MIQALEPDEWRELRELRLRALRQAPEAFFRTAAEEEAFDEPVWRARLGADPESPAVRWFVARADPGLVGLACGRVDPEESSAIHVFSMWVDPVARRAGVGRRLLDAVIDWAHARDVRSVHLGVMRANGGARALYASRGFEEVDSEVPMGTPASVSAQDVIAMRLELV